MGIHCIPDFALIKGNCTQTLMLSVVRNHQQYISMFRQLVHRGTKYIIWNIKVSVEKMYLHRMLCHTISVSHWIYCRQGDQAITIICPSVNTTKLHWGRVKIGAAQAQVIDWCLQAAGHNPSQCRLKFILPYGIHRSQCVKFSPQPEVKPCVPAKHTFAAEEQCTKVHERVPNKHQFL